MVRHRAAQVEDHHTVQELLVAGQQQLGWLPLATARDALDGSPRSATLADVAGRRRMRSGSRRPTYAELARTDSAQGVVAFARSAPFGDIRRTAQRIPRRSSSESTVLSRIGGTWPQSMRTGRSTRMRPASSYHATASTQLTPTRREGRDPSAEVSTSFERSQEFRVLLLDRRSRRRGDMDPQGLDGMTSDTWLLGSPTSPTGRSCSCSAPGAAPSPRWRGERSNVIAEHPDAQVRSASLNVSATAPFTC